MKDSTAELQNLINSAGKSLTIKPGTYWIDASKGLKLKSNFALTLNGVTLRAIPTALEHYRILDLRKAENVRIEGGCVVGERNSHKGATGQWGCGVLIVDAKNITLLDTAYSDCWGDGVHVWGVDKLTMKRVKCLRNRRNGMSITKGKNILVEHCEFSYSKGTRPMDGIDVEPNHGEKPKGVVDGVTVRRCKFVGNGRYGFQVMSKHGVVRNVRIDGCTFTSNIPIRINVEKGSLLARAAGLLKVYGLFPTTAVIA